LPGMPAITATA